MKHNRVETLNKELMIKEMQKILVIDREITKNMGVMFTDKEWGKEEFFREVQGNKWVYSKVAYTDDELVGYLIASEWYKAIKIHRIAVEKSHRGKGIGERMYLALLAEAYNDNMNWIHLEVHKSNQKAIKLYENLGLVRAKMITKDGCYLYWKKIEKEEK